MQPYRYLVRNKQEKDFLLDYLKENFIEFYDWIYEFSDLKCYENISFFCEKISNELEKYDFCWCDDCSTCEECGCGESEKFITFKVIQVSNMLRTKKLERICNHIDI